MIDLDAIKARAEAATTGPWTFENGEYSGKNWMIGSLFCGADDVGDGWTVHITTDHVHASQLYGGGASADAAFIAAARTDVPALVAEVERLTLALNHERDVVAAYQQAQDGLMAEVEALRAALRGIYGTVSVKPTWERRWPHVNALVRKALGLE